MRNKKRSGVTLLELAIAVFVLVVVAGPMFGVYMMASNQNIFGYKTSLATFYAQQKIEEFVGLNLTGDEGIAVRIGKVSDDGQPDADVFPDYDKEDEDKIGTAVALDGDGLINMNAAVQFLKNPDGYDNLLLVRVSVYDGDGSSAEDLLCVQENYILLSNP